jgi:hypothetical protein
MTKRSNKFNRAMDAMRRPDARMIQTNFHGRPDYWIAPSGHRVEPDVAQKIINHPQVVGARMRCFLDIIRRGECVRVTMPSNRAAQD